MEFTSVSEAKPDDGSSSGVDDITKYIEIYYEKKKILT